MKARYSVLVVGRSRRQIEEIEAALQGEPGIEVKIRPIVNGHADPLHGLNEWPGVIILDLSGLWKEELDGLMQRPLQDERTQLIVIGPEANAEMIKLAMRAGARDFFSHPLPLEDLWVAIRRLTQETNGPKGGGKTAPLTAVINAKGGSGASFLACNIAHCITACLKRRVALIDLDLQFGTLPLYLDLTPRESVSAALSAADHLDSVALEGYMLKHRSGVRLLSSTGESLALPWEISAESLTRLLMQTVLDYEHVMVDLPRQIDPLTSRVIEHANQVLVVLQQSISHVRDAKRMVRIITKEFAVPRDRVHMVINRYDKKNTVTVQDIRASTEAGSVLVVPNDYGRVSEAINIGEPLYEAARNATITKAIVEIAAKLAGQPEHARSKGFMGNLFASLSRE